LCHLLDGGASSRRCRTEAAWRAPAAPPHPASLRRSQLLACQHRRRCRHRSDAALRRHRGSPAISRALCARQQPARARQRLPQRPVTPAQSASSLLLCSSFGGAADRRVKSVAAWVSFGTGGSQRHAPLQPGHRCQPLPPARRPPARHRRLRHLRCHSRCAELCAPAKVEWAGVPARQRP
jgi:hypothetical protein